MPNENDILLHSAENRQGYSAWILTPSGVSIVSTIDAIAESFVSVAENRQGYSAWIQSPSGVNIPSIEEQIVGVPETEEFVTCIGVNVPTLEEQIIGVEPIPVEPAVGGGTYAPVFAERFIEIEEELTSYARSSFEVVEMITVEEILTSSLSNIQTVRAWYRKPQYFVYPTMPEIEIPPRLVYKQSNFPDELPSGKLLSETQKMQQHLLLLDLL